MQEIKTTARVVGFAEEFITAILEDHGYDLIELDSGRETGYMIMGRKRPVLIVGESNVLLSLDDVAGWIDDVLFAE